MEAEADGDNEGCMVINSDRERAEVSVRVRRGMRSDPPGDYRGHVGGGHAVDTDEHWCSTPYDWDVESSQALVGWLWGSSCCNPLLGRLACRVACPFR